MRISISSLKLYKACPQAYFFKYVEGLEPIDNKSEALEVGSSYHEKLEELYKTGDIDISDMSKASAMACAYMKYIYPKFKMQAVEEWKEKTLQEKSDNLDEIVLFGRIDGFSEDGLLVEHKTTGLDLNEYEYNLEWDEQVLAYMSLTGARQVYYTICKKPTIRQKKGETDGQFFDRMREWYDEDTDSKIRLVKLTRTNKQVGEFDRDVRFRGTEMKAVHELPFYNVYRNTCHCNNWGRRCEYSSICLNYDKDQEYVEFEKKQRRTQDGD